MIIRGPITPKPMVRWETVKSLQNRLGEGYLLMTINFWVVRKVLAQMAKNHEGPILVLWKTAKSLQLRLEEGTFRLVSSM